MYEKPNLDKNSGAFMRLDTILSNNDNVNLSFKRNKKKIVILHRYKEPQNLGDFTFDELENIHPTILDLTIALSEGKIYSLEDTWHFLCNDTVHIKTYTNGNLLYSGGLTALDSNDAETYENNNVFLKIDGFVVKPVKTEKSIYLVKREPKWLTLTKDELATYFPGLKSIVDSALALGFSDADITTTWNAHLAQINSIKNLPVTMPEVIGII